MNRAFGVLLIALVGVAVRATSTRGVMTEFADKYPVADGSVATFTCIFSGGSVPLAFVNDDYCDCADGSDEPGTSACSRLLLTGKMGSNFKFQCDNKGFRAQTFLHSRVNDGICDCCDGSDEYKNQDVACRNTCADDQERAEREAKELEEKRQAGLRAKAELVAKAKAKHESLTAELADLRAALPDTLKQLADVEQTKRLAEEDEEKERDGIRARSLAEKAIWEENEAKRKAELDAAAATATPSEGDAAVVPPPQPSGSEGNTADDSSEGAGIECRSWRQTKDCKGESVREPASDSPCDHLVEAGRSGFCDCFITATKEEQLHPFDCGHKPLRCSAVCTYGPTSDKAFEDKSSDSLESAGAPATPGFQLNDGKSHTTAAANDARQKHAELVAKQHEQEEKIKNLEADLAKDYGPENIFRAWQGVCYNRDAGREYTYSLCPFDEIKQGPIGGHLGTSLGRWKSWGEQTYSFWGSKQDFGRMKFEGGTHCYSGPARSTEVQVVCGPSHEILSIEEPSMCVYKIVFQTPAVCE